jgi:intracellular sulfur oxidation DsrE/DsrF family protein
MSQSLARATGGNAEEIYNELLANNIPGSRFVPAGVVAAARSQEHGYSLIYAG